MLEALGYDYHDFEPEEAKVQHLVQTLLQLVGKDKPSAHIIPLTLDSHLESNELPSISDSNIDKTDLELCCKGVVAADRPYVRQIFNLIHELEAHADELIRGAVVDLEYFTLQRQELISEIDRKLEDLDRRKIKRVMAIEDADRAPMVLEGYNRSLHMMHALFELASEYSDPDSNLGRYLL